MEKIATDLECCNDCNLILPELDLEESVEDHTWRCNDCTRKYYASPAMLLLGMYHMEIDNLPA
jgi:hypothetical protein